MSLKKIFKKIIAIVLVLIFSVNSFAAVVSDNDGSAFITKAEFESLKNNFQNQLNQYNITIGNKIDNAIVSYLAGIKVDVKTDKPIIVGNWGYYTIMNGSVDNEYAYPDFSGTTSWLGNAVNTNFRKTWFGFGEIKYAGTQNSNRRVLLKNITPAETLDLSNATWAGVATNARESWVCSIVFRNDNLTGYGGVNENNRYMWVFSPLNINVHGYYNNLNTVSDVWNHQWQYEGRGYASGQWVWYYPGNYPISAFSNSAAIEYRNDGAGNIYEYEHLGNWHRYTTWECTIKDCINYFGISNYNSLRTDTWLPLTTTSGGWTAQDISRANGNNVDWQNNRSINWDDRRAGNPPTSNSTVIPTIGLIESDIQAKDIWQFERLYDGDGILMDRMTMEQGIPIMKVKKGDKVEWSPEFINVKIAGVASDVELCPVLAYTPFISGKSVSDNKNYVKFDDKERGEFPITENHKIKLKFEAEKDGYVYMKWCPNIGNDVEVDGTEWEATIDFSKCSSYSVTKDY